MYALPLAIYSTKLAKDELKKRSPINNLICS
jgi:hypothetical protein